MGVLYLAYALYLTWPVATDPASISFGQQDAGRPGDLFGSIAVLREIVQDGDIPFLPGRLADFAAPAGMPIPWALNLATLPSTLVLWLLALPFGATAAYGLFTLGGYVATGTATFLLARRLIGDPWIAGLVGWAFAFCPVLVLSGPEHPHFVHGWVLVVVAWRALALAERPTVQTALWAAGAALLAFAWTPYFVLLGGIIFVVFVGAGVARSWRSEDRRRALGANTLAAVLAAAGLGVLGVVGSAGDGGVPGRVNPIQQYYQYSARPLEYVIPPRGHRLVGGQTGPFLAERMHGSNAAEATLYLGIPLLMLASLGLASAFRGRRRSSSSAVVATVVALAVVAAALSGPPNTNLGDRLIPLPSRVILALEPTYRVYSRFGIVVMLATCLLAAFGLRALVDGRTPRRRAALLVGVTALVVVDLGIRGPTTVGDLPVPRVYEVLRDLPPGAVAEYPIVPASQDGRFGDLYYQDVHNKPVLGGFPEGTLDEERALQVQSLSDLRTPRELAALGVRYAVVPISQVPPLPQLPPGLRLLREDGYAWLYELTARPTAVLAVSGGADAAYSDLNARWLVDADSAIHILTRCDPCKGVLRFRSMSFLRPRRVTVSGPAVRVAVTRTVPIERSVDFRVPLHFRRSTIVDVDVRPRPSPTAGTVDPPAPWPALSVRLEELSFDAR